MTNYFEKISGAQVLQNEPMSGHTSFKLGGCADYLVIPSDENSLSETLKTAAEHDIPYYIIGNGTNILVGDKGFRGAVIKLTDGFSEIKVNGNTITAQCGASLAKLSKTAAASGLSGFEFAEGIPGAVGGAVTMNAGAYGGEIKDIIRCARVMTPQGEVFAMSAEELELGYRTSAIQKKGLVCLSAEFELSEGDETSIKAKMDENRQKRIEKQPIEKPSAGSTFKRPEGYFAGKLIMDAGLRGFKMGGAMVSEKHCGFVINDGGATARDVYDLIKHIQKEVYEKFEVKLEPEIRIIGEF